MNFFLTGSRFEVLGGTPLPEYPLSQPSPTPPPRPCIDPLPWEACQLQSVVPWLEYNTVLQSFYCSKQNKRLLLHATPV